MAQIVFTLPDNEAQELKKKATSLGLTTSGYIRQILQDSQQKKPRQDTQAVSMAVRRLIPVLADGLGRSQNQNQQVVEKLTQILLKKYDQGDYEN